MANSWPTGTWIPTSS